MEKSDTERFGPGLLQNGWNFRSEVAGSKYDEERPDSADFSVIVMFCRNGNKLNGLKKKRICRNNSGYFERGDPQWLHRKRSRFGLFRAAGRHIATLSAACNTFGRAVF